MKAYLVCVLLLSASLLSGCQSLSQPTATLDKAKSGVAAPIHNLSQGKRCSC